MQNETETAPAPIPVVEMRGVSVGSLRNPGLALVREVDWRVEAGDYWVIAGLQGSGKTDLLTLAAGLMAPLRGSYRMLGQPMPIFEEPRLAHRLRLGMVFDNGQLLNHLTIAENVGLPLRYHRNLPAAAAREEVQRYLECMDLAPWADSTPGAIGRNWAKRAGLARALILKPEFLLVDSPLGGLDLPHTAWWLAFLDRLARGDDLTGGRPLTLVVTTADLRPWKGRAQKFAVLRDGRFSVLGNWMQLERASQELLRELLAMRETIS